MVKLHSLTPVKQGCPDLFPEEGPKVKLHGGPQPKNKMFLYCID